ncbi:MAG: carboxypeptidase-like regulatory domain-containing protein, partial [Planctomycetaceae bacterium]|nr:carboxypeptidase-like regulatory domain-containing protein [Planctomycetaceae bacterium]
MLKKITFFQLVIFAAILLTTGGVKAEQKYPLTVKILDSDGRAFKDKNSYINFTAQLWQKVDNNSAVEGTYSHPVVHSPDGSVWRQINLFGFYNQQSSIPDWIAKHDVAVGEYRVTFTVSERLERQNISDAVKVIYWGMSDPIVIDDSKAGKEVEVRADAGSKVRIRTTFFPDPNEEPKKDDKNSTTSDTKINEANEIQMRIFREENFSTDRRLSHYFGEGIPSFVDFEQMKPGRYKVHFFRGSSSPEAGRTKATDVFSFEVTKDGKNEFVFTPVKSLAENATWQITGTVRDTNGSPIAGCVVSLTDVRIPIIPYYYSSYRSTATDAEGKYQLAVTPFWSQAGTFFDEKDKCLRWGFCVQQANLGAVIDDKFKPEYKRNLVFIGDVSMSTSEEFQKRLAERKEPMILISPNQPATVDFVLTPEKPLKYNNQK